MRQRKISTLDLTIEEQERVRTALHYLHARVNGWKPLGKVLHFDYTTLIHVARGRRAVCASLTFRIARLVKVSIDDLLAGRFPEEGLCPRCGFNDPRNKPKAKR